MADTINIDPGRWMSSALRACSLEARGLWSDLLCVMHAGQSRGHLRTDAGTPMGHTHIARIAGIPTDRAEALIKELEDAGVATRRDGCLCCAWMIEDEKHRAYERDRKRSQRARTRPPPQEQDRGGEAQATRTDAGTTTGQERDSTRDSQRGVGGVLSLSAQTPEKTELENPEVKRLTDKKNQSKARAQDETPGFDAFWDAWPKHHRKEERAKCLAKWQQYGLEHRTSEVLQGLDLWKRSQEWDREGGRFIPAPHPWLNKRKWEVAGTLKLADDEAPWARPLERDPTPEELESQLPTMTAAEALALGAKPISGGRP